MFTYAVAKGVNRGWLDKSFASIALRGWDGIKTKISENGDVSGICVGTGLSRDLVFYYQRPAPLSDVHGLGAVIEAGLEIIQLQKTRSNNATFFLSI
jgi:unsaturated rhamnogalacturonyl hydrolase